MLQISNLRPRVLRAFRDAENIELQTDRRILTPKHRQCE